MKVSSTPESWAGYPNSQLRIAITPKRPISAPSVDTQAARTQLPRNQIDFLGPL